MAVNYQITRIYKVVLPFLLFVLSLQMAYANVNEHIKQLRANRELIIYQKITSSDSLAYLQELKKEAINNESPTLLAEVSYNIGLIEGNRGNYLNALPALTRAIENLPSLNPQDSLILFNDLAIAHIVLREFSSAAKYIFTLEGLYDRHPSLVSNLKIQLTPIDQLYHRAEMNEKAIDWFDKMVKQKLYLDKSKPYDYVLQIRNLGNYHFDLNQTDSALFKYQKAYNIVESSGFEDKEILMGRIKGQIADCYLIQENFAKAIPMYKDEFLTLLRNKDSVLCAHNLNQLALAELKTKDYDNAIRHLKYIDSLVTRADEPQIFLSRNLLLSDVFGELNQYDSAYYYAQLFIKLQDYLQNSQQAKEASLIELSSQLESNEMKLERALLQEYKQRQLSLEIRFTRNLAIVAGTIITLILFYVLYLLIKRSEKKRELEQLLMEFENKANELQESLNQKETLIKEVHHRVKNNLQIVSGILQLQALYASTKEIKTFITKSQFRIQSMALIHQLLYQNQDLNHIAIKDYIHKLTHQLLMQHKVNPAKIKANYYVPDLDINVEDAVNIGLILNELITNVIEHAYPGDEKGQIDIWLKHVKDNDYQLIIADDGPGINATVPEVSKVGLKLAELLVGQIKSKLIYTYKNGAEFSFIFKVKK